MLPRPSLKRCEKLVKQIMWMTKELKTLNALTLFNHLNNFNYVGTHALIMRTVPKSRS